MSLRFSLLLASMALLLAGRAEAQLAPDASWQPQWTKVRGGQYMLMGGLIAAEVYFELGPVRSASQPRTTGPWLFDQPVRELLAADMDAQRDIDSISDFFWHPTQWFPIYADVLIAALAVHGESETAWQLLAISGQALLGTAVIVRMLHLSVRRQRPVYYEAERRGIELGGIGTAETLSFPSGHAATAFAAAGLTCSFHRHIPLFGHGAWNDAACIATLAGATTTAALRMVADRHYATDTLLGSGLGFTLGYLLPELFHFGEGAAESGSGRLQLLPYMGRRQGGFLLHGSY
jgi:membrane-associated phospholipid phosphatase